MAAFMCAACAAAPVSASLTMRGATHALAYKRDAYRKLWEDESGLYARFVSETGREPSREAGGDERLRAMWAEDVMRLSEAGDLTPGQADIAMRAGIAPVKAGCEEPAWTAPESAAGWAFGCMPALACAIVAPTAGPAGICAFAAATCAASCAALCDMSARIIPWEACLALAAGGAAWQWTCGGSAALASSALAFAACAAAMALCRAIVPKGSIGAGDMRMICACGAACGTGTAMAAGAMALIWTVWTVSMAARGKALSGAKVPLGPSIAAGCAMGMALPQLAAAFA